MLQTTRFALFPDAMRYALENKMIFCLQDEIAMRESEMRATLERLSSKDGSASPARGRSDSEQIARKYEARVSELEEAMDRMRIGF